MKNDQLHTRRNFINTSLKAGVALSVGSAAVGSFLSSCNNSASANNAAILTTGFTQTPLAYAYNALEKAIDAATMEIHYTKHAAAYAKALQEAVGSEGVDAKTSLENVLSKISKYSTKMRNNAGGHYNHELFWKSLSATGSGKANGKLLTAIEQQFNSFDAFKNQLTDAGKNRFGSGWAWLYVDGSKDLKIDSTPNQDNPLMDASDIKGVPLLGLDVWEHAYYLRYQNKRPDYIEAWWSVVNWDYVSERYQAVLG
jgi:Fe-Mn family superoxide dismutase